MLHLLTPECIYWPTYKDCGYHSEKQVEDVECYCAVADSSESSYTWCRTVRVLGDMIGHYSRSRADTRPILCDVRSPERKSGSIACSGVRVLIKSVHEVSCNWLLRNAGLTLPSPLLIVVLTCRIQLYSALEK